MINNIRIYIDIYMIIIDDNKPKAKRLSIYVPTELHIKLSKFKKDNPQINLSYSIREFLTEYISKESNG